MRYVMALAALVLALQGHAQAPGVLEEIVVTASLRETNLLDTPAAISAFDFDTRQLLKIENALDVVGRTPSLSITTFRVSLRDRRDSVQQVDNVDHQPRVKETITNIGTAPATIIRRKGEVTAPVEELSSAVSAIAGGINRPAEEAVIHNDHRERLLANLRDLHHACDRQAI